MCVGKPRAIGESSPKNSCAKARVWLVCKWAATAGRPSPVWRATECIGRSCRPLRYKLIYSPASRHYFLRILRILYPCTLHILCNLCCVNLTVSLQLLLSPKQSTLSSSLTTMLNVIELIPCARSLFPLSMCSPPSGLALAHPFHVQIIT